MKKASVTATREGLLLLSTSEKASSWTLRIDLFGNRGRCCRTPNQETTDVLILESTQPCRLEDENSCMDDGTKRSRTNSRNSVLSLWASYRMRRRGGESSPSDICRYIGHCMQELPRNQTEQAMCMAQNHGLRECRARLVFRCCVHNVG